MSASGFLPRVTNTPRRGLFLFAQKVLPSLLDSVKTSAHPPSLLITGATASIKGSSFFHTFATGKFALRGLGQSLAREFGPRGVHVAHIIVDGVVDIPRTQAWTVNDGVEDGKLEPEAVSFDPCVVFGLWKCAVELTWYAAGCGELLAPAHAAPVRLYAGD
ncbi:hypothetical protein IMZ48_34200 [Candidatus Bathyarchaeota archaeon]|nr:hypothetical protein [Candidatus Bathyarchaeota archaeon]